MKENTALDLIISGEPSNDYLTGDYSISDNKDSKVQGSWNDLPNSAQFNY